MSKNIPIHGSMTRPADPNTAIEEVKQGRQKWTGGKLAVSASRRIYKCMSNNRAT